DWTLYRRGGRTEFPNSYHLQTIAVCLESDLVLPRPLSLIVLPPPIDPGEYQEYLLYPHRAFQDPASTWLANISSGDW
ncbi:MAG TPA: hypothetical protein VGM27_30080, partial [Acidobacteriaceae bacterium]